MAQDRAVGPDARLARRRHIGQCRDAHALAVGVVDPAWYGHCSVQPSTRPSESRVPRCAHRSCQAIGLPSACQTTMSSPSSRAPIGRRRASCCDVATGCQSSTSTGSSITSTPLPRLLALPRRMARAPAGHKPEAGSSLIEHRHRMPDGRLAPPRPRAVLGIICHRETAKRSWRSRRVRIAWICFAPSGARDDGIRVTILLDRGA
jgi:hypothetical protein